MEQATQQGVHLWFLLWKAEKKVEARARLSFQTMGLCLSDFGALEALLHKGPLPVNELGKKLLLTSGSITTAVDRLVRSGLVERVDAETDRRSRLVRLTGKGTKLIVKLFIEHVHDMQRAFANLDKKERVALADLLSKVGRDTSRDSAKGRKTVARKKEEGTRSRGESASRS